MEEEEKEEKKEEDIVLNTGFSTSTGFNQSKIGVTVFTQPFCGRKKKPDVYALPPSRGYRVISIIYY